jgi:Helix-turn-helix domain
MRNEDWLLLTDAAARTGLSPNTLRDQRRKGRLAAEQRGRDYWVKWGDVQAYLASRSTRGRYRADIKPEYTATEK